MSESIKNDLSSQPWKFQKGNQAAALPYEYKLIRDNLKTNLFKAVNFLNFTHVEAEKFLEQIQREIDNNEPTEITMLEAIVAEAVVKRKWDVIDFLFEKIFPKSAINIQIGEGKTMLDEISEDQKRNAIEAASRTIESKK